MQNSNIQWTEHTWNPTRGCSLALMPGPNGKPVLREGCRNCYAKEMAARFSGVGRPYDGYAMFQGGKSHWTGIVNLIEERLEDPLKWATPSMIFVNSMSDIFHDGLSEIDIVEVVATMALAHWHTFQVLTKRPERMKELLTSEEFWALVKDTALLQQSDWNHKRRPSKQLAVAGFEIPLRNVWWGCSIEDQASADYVMPFLSQTPAFVRWLSIEPMLGEIDLGDWLWKSGCEPHCGERCSKDIDCPFEPSSLINWGVIGGESGKNARPFNVDHGRSLVKQFVSCGVPLFVKQLGAHPTTNGITGPGEHWPKGVKLLDTGKGHLEVSLRDAKGGDMQEWPEDLRIRQWPKRGI